MLDFKPIPFPWTADTPDQSIGNVYAANGEQVIQVQQIPLAYPRTVASAALEVPYRRDLTAWVAMACSAHDPLVAALKMIAAGHGCPSALAADALEKAGVV